MIKKNTIPRFKIKYGTVLTRQKAFYKYILLIILVQSIKIFSLSQPEELTVLVEISNIAFSLIFAIEMILKIIADGLFGYISNGFNVFDGVIVILRYSMNIIHLE